MKRVLPMVILGIACFSLPPAQASMLGLWHDTHAKDNPHLVVAGHIAQIHNTRQTRNRYIRFDFKVETVVFGDRSKASEIITTSRTRALDVWPKWQLAPYQEGARCIVIFHAQKYRNEGQPYIVNILPLHSQSVSYAKTREELTRILSAELLGELKSEDSISRQAFLIREMSPILTADDAAKLTPFLESKEPWLRRAALTCLVRATKKDKYIKMAVDDIKASAKVGRHTSINYFGASGMVPFPLFFDHYYFLDSSTWHFQDSRNVEAYLPLFRTVSGEISNELEHDIRYQMSHGIWPLCRVGTKDDLPFLYKYYVKTVMGNRKKPYWHSKNLLKGMARILSIEKDWDTYGRDTIDEKEPRIAKAIHAAMLEAGIIEDAVAPTIAEQDKELDEAKRLPNAVQGKKLSVSFRETPLSEVLSFIGELLEVECSLASDLGNGPSVTFSADAMLLNTVFDQLAKKMDLKWEVRNDTVYFYRDDASEK